MSKSSNFALVFIVTERGWKGRGALKIRTLYLAAAHSLSRFGATFAIEAGHPNRLAESGWPPKITDRSRRFYSPEPKRSASATSPAVAPGLRRSDKGCRPLDSYEIFT